MGKMEECQEKGRKKMTEKEGKSLKTGGNGGKWRNDRKKVGKKRRKIVENRGKMEECQEKGRKKTTEKEGKSLKTDGNGGKWRNDRKKV